MKVSGLAGEKLQLINEKYYLAARLVLTQENSRVARTVVVTQQ